MKKIYLILLVIIISGVGGFYLFSSQSGKGNESQEKSAPAQVAGSFIKGETAPDITLINFNGQIHKLADYKGRAVVLDFWAAWCPFCLNEMPELQKAQETYANELVMIGVHRSDTENKRTALEFTQDRGISYLLVTDTDGSLYRASGGFGMPVAVFIDKKGIVNEIKSGPKTKEEIEEKVFNLVRK